MLIHNHYQLQADCDGPANLQHEFITITQRLLWQEITIQDFSTYMYEVTLQDLNDKHIKILRKLQHRNDSKINAKDYMTIKHTQRSKVAQTE